MNEYGLVKWDMILVKWDMKMGENKLSNREFDSVHVQISFYDFQISIGFFTRSIDVT